MPTPRLWFDLNRGHGWRGGVFYPGAVIDLNRNGLIDLGEREVDIALAYADAALARIHALGHEGRVISRGFYAERWRASAALARDWEGYVVHVACHLNAGGGDYAGIFYDYRSPKGAAVAPAVARHLGDAALPGISRVSSYEAKPGTWTGNAYETIKGIGDPGTPARLFGLCVEPAFLDSTAHRALVTGNGPALLGTTLADALVAGVLETLT